MSTLMQDHPELGADVWPALALEQWEGTRDTLHMWLQIVGKTRLALTPLVNHWWNVPLYVTARGLSTGPMPCGARDVSVEFDFIEHDLAIDSSDGRRKALPLIARSVADFWSEYMLAMKALDVRLAIWPTPVEVTDPIRFEDDHEHAAYDAEHAHRFWHALAASHRVFQEFRASFLGKCSPVHFFWGSLDLAVTRFSGRRSPESANADPITREAYSHECISHGFWPGGSWFGTKIDTPLYYSYTVPAPQGLADAPIRPAAARFDPQLKEFILPYDAVREAASPRDLLLEFLQSTYEAGARLAGWDRSALERAAPAGGSRGGP